ncbi:MAG: hypothetical protein QF858_03490, partial [Candidatus Pacebacteria bacterium]|nr:hypothetical protein [Candidatus Paceibacterota bacterium]
MIKKIAHVRRPSKKSSRPIGWEKEFGALFLHPANYIMFDVESTDTRVTEIEFIGGMQIIVETDNSTYEIRYDNRARKFIVREITKSQLPNSDEAPCSRKVSALFLHHSNHMMLDGESLDNRI